jgi:hypothetical protein
MLISDFILPLWDVNREMNFLTRALPLGIIYGPVGALGFKVPLP